LCCTTEKPGKPKRIKAVLKGYASETFFAKVISVCIYGCADNKKLVRRYFREGLKKGPELLPVLKPLWVVSTGKVARINEIKNIISKVLMRQNSEPFHTIPYPYTGQADGVDPRRPIFIDPSYALFFKGIR